MNAVTVPSPVAAPLALGLALLGGLAAAVAGPAAVALALGAGLVLTIAVRPMIGAGLWLVLGPLIVGIARGDGAMVLRPNEALLLAVMAGVALRIAWLAWNGDRWLPQLGRIDLAVAALAAAGCLVPLAVRYGRGLELSADDVFYALVFVKYFLVYALFRLAVRRPEEVATCLRLALASAVVVGIVAVLQVKGLAGVPALLDRYYDAPFTAPVGPITERGTSTIASPFGVADVMCLCLAITIAWLLRGGAARLPLFLAAGVFVAGCLAAGSFSGFIGAAIVALSVGFVCGRLLKLTVAMVPAALVATAVFWPTVANRLEGFDSRMGLPKSWLGRIANLERFVWPELSSGLNWLWGVRPSARIPAPEAWRDWVYIESGHAWLLWAGGVPLLAAFLVLSWVVCRDTLAIARHDDGPVAIAATAAFAGMTMIFTLMLLDPHLTVRGCADLFFPLLALAVVGQDRVIGSRSRPAAG
ncbi:MAG TPA: hypothetical protein PKA33_12975 [Amaricoccus sp.]|uniref:hypothetical protein n=1 Tax=Amaricoccus sp. TaxID=1872485 RepID=UPI002BC557F3|nr:hypothetical protein [Amaricoccus sp.]HMR31269.1 hypothetical protein [Geminicoccus sp.]HMU00265.1 hypothetical protein [Amaricoccus sp.]